MSDLYPDLIRLTVCDERTIACPLCGYALDVPPVPVVNEIGKALGMTGNTLAVMHAEQAAIRATRTMADHLKTHDLLTWLRAVKEGAS